MNFVAHAVVAATEGDSAYAFGAMVPDLRAFVAGSELLAPTKHRADVDAGIRSHHRVDSAFHADGQFKAWMARVSNELGNTRAGRAAAHVAVELAIDGQLLVAGRAQSFYDALEWAGGALDGRWLTLVEHLATDELVGAYSTADGVARRTVGAISRRPRLGRLELDAAALAVAIGNIGPLIAAGLDDVLRSAGGNDDRLPRPRPPRAR